MIGLGEILKDLTRETARPTPSVSISNPGNSYG